MQRLYIFVGSNKDKDGACRAAIAEITHAFGGEITENIADADVIAALGGDGTMMRAAHAACERNIPVIGINLGRVGYMTELDKTELSLIGNYFKGEYKEESRMMLSVTVNGRSYYGLNDAVFHSKNRHMCKYTLISDGKKVNEYRGDGIIVSTPTGSTAYSMSAGGSVIDPRLSCICVTPICAQSLTARPLIFAPDSKLTVKTQSKECMLTVDGTAPIPLELDSVVEIERSERAFRMIKLKEDGFFEILRSKRLG